MTWWPGREQAGTKSTAFTKRPARMAEFAIWLQQHAVDWPTNLVALTTITGPRTAFRAEHLLNVPSRCRGLSLEPLFGPVDFPLDGINWVIVGGGSDVLAEAFHVEWALALREKCRARQIPFFLKQLGKNPFFEGKALNLKNPHGGDWNEWPLGWRTREIPKAFMKPSC